MLGNRREITEYHWLDLSWLFTLFLRNNIKKSGHFVNTFYFFSLCLTRSKFHGRMANGYSSCWAQPTVKTGICISWKNQCKVEFKSTKMSSQMKADRFQPQNCLRKNGRAQAKNLCKSWSSKSFIAYANPLFQMEKCKDE